MQTVKLGYNKTDKRYTKMVKGKIFRSTRGLGKSKDDKQEATQQYWRWFNQTFLPENVAAVVEDFEVAGMAEDANRVRELAVDGKPISTGDKFPHPSTLYSLLDAMPNSPEDITDETFRDLYRQIGRLARVMNTGDRITEGRNRAEGLTVEKAADLFVAYKETRNKKHAVDTLRSQLNRVTDYFRHTSVDNIRLEQWERLYNSISSDIKNGELSARTGNNVMKAGRQLFGWLADTERLASVPRFIDAKAYRIKVPHKVPLVFTVDEISRVMQVSDDRARCWWLLCLNCSMTQSDIASLTASQIDFKKGTLTRKRGKHENQTSADVPTVVYHLWPETLKLLQAVANKKGLCFQNRQGKPLVNDSTYYDAVADYWDSSVRKQAATGRKTVKVFRKSGVSALGTEKQTRTWRELYLANAGEDITTKHYDNTTLLPATVTDHIRVVLGIDKIDCLR